MNELMNGITDAVNNLGKALSGENNKSKPDGFKEKFNAVLRKVLEVLMVIGSMASLIVSLLLVATVFITLIRARNVPETSCCHLRHLLIFLIMTSSKALIS